MQESLAPEHGGELFRDTLEELLNGGAVAQKGHGHLESLGRDIADGGLDVVGDPLHKVAGVLVLDVEHLLIDFLHGDLTTEHGGNGEVASLAGIASGHHVLGIEHLLGELGDVHGAEGAGGAAGQGSESNHEEVKTGEGDHVDGQFAEIGVELSGETEAGGDTGHDEGD